MSGVCRVIVGASGSPGSLRALRYAEDLPAHRALLSRGVALLEDLALEAIEEGTYQLVALPLRLDALDASPVRAILIRD